MAEAAQIEKTIPAPEVRRFEVSDLDRHGTWLLPRLKQTFPHLNDRGLIGFLRGIIENNEYLFLFEENSCALAQLMTAHTLQPKPVVWERWVWARDPQDKDNIAATAFMYDRFRDWAKALGVETIIVKEMSDVPHEIVRQKFGRVFNRQQQFARI